MKIAVAYDDGQIFQHFGQTRYFKLYNVENGEVKGSDVVDFGGDVHCAMAGILKEHDVDTLICGGIGMGAQNNLAQAGIKLYGGVSGSADQAVQDLIADKLAFNPDVQCGDHEHGHHHEHGHNCGSHGGGCKH